MKKCPYCGFQFPDNKKVCPNCGSPYWKPEDDKELSELYDDTEDDKNGCLSLLFMPITVSLIVTAFLVLSGFIINLLIHFESSQIKLLWIGLSILLGLLFYNFFKKKQKYKKKSNKELPK